MINYKYETLFIETRYQKYHTVCYILVKEPQKGNKIYFHQHCSGDL